MKVWGKSVCTIRVWGEILETICSTSFPWYCFPYVHFLNSICLVCIVVILCVFVTLCVYCSFTLDAGLVAKSQYPEGPATGHLDTGFSWFPCVYKRMLRGFLSFQVATTCFSCNPTDLNFLVTYLTFVYM